MTPKLFKIPATALRALRWATHTDSRDVDFDRPQSPPVAAVAGRSAPQGRPHGLSFFGWLVYREPRNRIPMPALTAQETSAFLRNSASSK